MSHSLPLVILGRPGDPRPTVSVLVKAYNHAAYVRRTIDSILAQSFQDFEIVVTDDASTDGTADILRSYRDPRIKLATLSVNLGISGAMNATIDRSRGRYLAILNSDDWSFPGRLQQQVDCLARNPEISLVFGLPKMIGEHDEPVQTENDFAAPLRFPDMSRTTWLRYFFYNANCLSAPTAMIRREAYKTVGAYDRRLTNLQDFDMWIRMLAAGFNIRLLPDEVTAVRIRANQANMSAPSLGKMIRSGFELGKILRRYASMDQRLLDGIFGAALGGPHTTGKPMPMRLAELALRDSRREYHAFALDLIYENAADQADFDWLRELAETLDPRGWRAIEHLRGALTAQTAIAENRPIPDTAAPHRDEIGRHADL